MSAPETGAQPSFAERVELLRERGARIQADFQQRLAAVEAQIADAVPPNPVRARVSVDERGFPASLELVDPSGDATPPQLRAALTGAFLSARATRPTVPAEAAESLRDVLSSLTADPQHVAERIAEQGTTVSNDLGQARVTALFGDVTAVDAQDSWLATVRPDDIAAEVLALAQRAALASDRFGRFTPKEDAHG